VALRVCLVVALTALTGPEALAAPAGAPGLSLVAFVGDLADQRFVTLTGELERMGQDGARTEWRCRPATAEGERWELTFEATCVREGDTERWRYRVANDRPGATVCSVTFPIVEGVRPGGSWEGSRVLWPSLYQGALVDDLRSQEAFEEQCRAVCKDVPRLFGRYQGDLCLPFFVHLGGGESFGIMASDPTHEVLTFEGFREAEGMRYQVTTSPRVRPGGAWSFGDIEVFRGGADWHAPADRYREWLIAQGFEPQGPRRGDVAAFTYGRWDGLLPEEAIRWAKALDIRDVCLWVVLYGRGDQYYPCYFPRLELGVEGMTAKLRELRDAGLVPYFYTNGYLLSPLQTPEDAAEWSRKYPDRYPDWLAKGDTGYAETVAECRAGGEDFAGEWLQRPGGILPVRVRRVSFEWGEFPVYFWHQRPFWAACVAAPEWRKLFRDTARLHARMGAGGVFVDQVAAIHPELCSAQGHGHDDDSFGMWNRAYLRLLEETKDAGEALAPGFFIETEGASDLYARYVDRYLCHFGKAPERGFPRMLKYTAPWVRTDQGQVGLDDPAELTRHIERTLLLGGVFRVSGGGPTGEDKPDDPRLTGEGTRLLGAAVRARRALVDFMDGGRYRDDVGLTAAACREARWFEGGAGVLIVAAAEKPGASVEVRATRGLDRARAYSLDWRTGAASDASVTQVGESVRAESLGEGLNLVVVPAR